MDSLEKDVNHCLVMPYAPMPAILWCLACIDFLGALLTGQASKKIPGTNTNVNTTENSQIYMISYMDYTQEQAELIQRIFRHKLVHLAQPGPLSLYKGKTVVWRYDHDFNPNHLILENFSPPNITKIKPGWQEHVDQRFTLGINQFVQDIKKSVFKSDGYLDKLKTEADIREQFRIAIQDVYAPQEIKNKVTNSTP
jgi:hypothetical protein